MKVNNMSFKNEEAKIKSSIFILRLVIYYLISVFLYMGMTLEVNWEYYKEGVSISHIFKYPLLVLLVIFFLWIWMFISLKLNDTTKMVAKATQLLSSYMFFLPILVLFFWSYYYEYIFFFEKCESLNLISSILLSAYYLLHLILIILFAFLRIWCLSRRLYIETKSVVYSVITSVLCLDSWWFIYYTINLIRLKYELF